LLSKSLENDEWEEFLDGTLADAIENPQTLEQRDLVAVVVAPLRNVNASPSLVERIATLLALPWAGIDREESVDEELIVRAYADTRVVPNLLYACKVIICHSLNFHFSFSHVISFRFLFFLFFFFFGCAQKQEHRQQKDGRRIDGRRSAVLRNAAGFDGPSGAPEYDRR
jgi:hypothetical protein